MKLNLNQIIMIKKISRFSTTVILSGCLAQLSFADMFFVTNGSDAGTGSLRQAILNSNSTLGADTILFNIPPEDASYDEIAGIWSIQPESQLPDITDDSTFINGLSQTLNRGNTNVEGPEIEINGTNSIAIGFVISSSHNIISNLIVNQFTVNGIYVSNASENLISGNYIGIDCTGTIAMGNYNGIRLAIGSADNLVGGDSPDERNIISGNTNCGLMIDGENTLNNKVSGNYIGTDKEGINAIGNRYAGLFIEFGADGTIVGGTLEGEGNVISGTYQTVNIYTGMGISIRHSENVKVFGNLIGTDKNGTLLLPNIGVGVAILEASNNFIGGTEPGETNLIGGNLLGGIMLRFNNTSGNVIAGNYIGTGPTGNLDLGNNETESTGGGILLEYGPRNNTIGPGNEIANNGPYGVKISQDTSTQNTITQSSIYNHTMLGIANLQGGNTELSSPVITSATDNLVEGTACSGCTVEVFSTPTYEGDVFEGTTLADESGHYSWAGTPVYDYVTATSTDATGNTSQFSEVVNYVPGTVNSIHGITTSAIPDQLVVEGCYPNPFAGNTRIKYGLPKNAHVDIFILDITGKKVYTYSENDQLAGYHSVVWYGRDTQGTLLPDGTYYCVVESLGNQVSTLISIIR